MMNVSPVKQLHQHAAEAHQRTEQVKAEAAAVAQAAVQPDPPAPAGEYGA